MIEAPFMGVPLMLYVIDGGGELALVDSGIASTPDAFVLPFFERLGPPARPAHQTPMPMSITFGRQRAAP